jgi:hypothetical protein
MNIEKVSICNKTMMNQNDNNDDVYLDEAYYKIYSLHSFT